jgi:hypothetical protein
MFPDFFEKYGGVYGAADVYRSVFAGLNGTTMQSYASLVPDESGSWALVACLLSLSPPRGPFCTSASLRPSERHGLAPTVASLLAPSRRREAILRCRILRLR